MIRALAVAVALATLLGGCGDGHNDPLGQDTGQTVVPTGGASSTPDGSPVAQRPPLEPGPHVDGGVVPDQLLVRGDADAYVTGWIKSVGGVVVEETSAGLRVGFEVDDLDELLRIRDELRAAGVPAQTIEASGVPDDPDDPA